MHITIKETVGESCVEFDITGDYEEVLALVTELGFCGNTSAVTVVNNVTISPEIGEKIRQAFLQAYLPGGVLSKY